jgi:hypothetical protein
MMLSYFYFARLVGLHDCNVTLYEYVLVWSFLVMSTIAIIVHYLQGFMRGGAFKIGTTSPDGKSKAQSNLHTRIHAWVGSAESLLSRQ